MRGFEHVPWDWAPASVWVDDDGNHHQTVEFIVAGQPVQQGNIIRNRYGSLYDKTKGLKEWRDKVAYCARAAMQGHWRRRTYSSEMGMHGTPSCADREAVRATPRSGSGAAINGTPARRDGRICRGAHGTQAHHGPLPMFEGAVMLDVTFVRERPKSLPKRTTPAHTKYPDLSKLVRAIEDALTGIVWHDDSQVVETHSRKRYAEPGERPGAIILVTTNVKVLPDQ